MTKHTETFSAGVMALLREELGEDSEKGLGKKRRELSLGRVG